MTTPGGPLPHDTSSIELLEDLGSEFSPAQIANFRTAFEVFDVNKDGKISTDEIFDVLQTMGNEVSDERKRKIREAVQAVDMEGNGELDFREFIQFMKIMDEINKLEAQARADDAARELDGGAFEERATFKYFFCMVIDIAYAKPNVVAQVLVYLILAYNIAYAIGVSALVIFEEDKWSLNPEAAEKPNEVNEYHQWIYYVRLANLLNFVHIIFIEVHSLFDALQYNGYSRTFSNYVRYVTRPVFVLNLAANVLLVIGHSKADLSLEFVTDTWEETALPLAQIVTTYFTMSYFFWFSTYVEPATPCEKFKVFLADLFFFNWLRLPVAIFKNVVVFIVMPFNILFFILNCFAQCCCPGLFNTKDVHSRTSRFLRLVAYHSG